MCHYARIGISHDLGQRVIMYVQECIFSDYWHGLVKSAGESLRVRKIKKNMEDKVYIRAWKEPERVLFLQDRPQVEDRR